MLRILGVELTQAIQYFDSTFPVCGSPPNLQPCANNSIPLIAGKPTAVRVYFDGAAQGVPVTGFGVRLYSDGSPSTMTFPATADLVNVPSPPTRADAGQSINIIIPAQASSGRWKLSLSVFEKPAMGIGQVAPWMVELMFVERAILPIRLVRLHYRRSPVGAPMIDIPAPTVAEFWSLAQGFVQHIWPSPLPVFCIVRESAEVFDGIYNNTNPNNNTPSSKGTTGSIDDILTTLRAVEGLPSDVIYCGFYPATGDAGLPGGGYGGGWTFVTPNVIPGLMAHELGHALGLPHAPTPSTANGDQSFPHYGSLKWGSIGEFGFDTITPPAVEPGSIPPGVVPARTAFDIMGYDVPRWISPHNYMKLFAAVGAPKPGPCSKSPPRATIDHPPLNRYFTCYFVEGLPEGGFIKTLCGPAISLEPWWPPRETLGPIRVTLFDAAGVTIFEDNVNISMFSEPQEGEDLYGQHDAPHQRGFWITVPALDGGTRLVVTHGEHVIEDIELTTQPVVFDANVWLLDDPTPTMHVEWRLSPEDATAPVFVRASSDGGSSWTAFNVPSGTSQLDIDPASLPPGNDCVVEVLAGERLRTTSWRSAHMSVQTGRDAVIVLAPRGDMSVNYGQVIELVATTTYGTGFEDLIWRSDHDGDLGTGGHQLARLSPGRHVLSVRLGTNGEQVTASVVKVINRPSPRIRKRP